MPVTLPPGRARLSTRPVSTGSAERPVITMGIVLVAFLATPIGLIPPATRMISTLRRTSSAARSGSRSRFPSAYRYSMVMFCPSMWPRSRRASRIPSARADSAAGSNDDRYPNRGTFFGCCAAAGKLCAKSRAHRASLVILLRMGFPSPSPSPAFAGEGILGMTRIAFTATQNTAA